MPDDATDKSERTTHGSEEGSVARAVRNEAAIAQQNEAGTAAEKGLGGIGEVIGHYKLIEVIGVGGFGVVWLAEQLEPVRRRVALKVIKPGMDSRAVIARFEAERQALAVMSHPNVAKVLDAGTTPAGPGGGGGRPYFVMEHVKGVAITEYCDRERLTVEQRLRLFVVVCDAVQHAHMRGIIHRDLKPSNILVTIAEGGEPRPVVIDFGVAKALAGRLTDATLHTERGVLIGTPEYMSPEQAESNESEIDTRTDVYSLGVILYELLTGALPFDSAQLRAKGQAEIPKFIREVEPPRPSTRLSTMGGLTAGAAAARNVRIEELAALLKKELEWVPLKAMRKDRAERYRSASELADDVRNYLEHRPLIAGPESAAYRARKFVRRNKGAVIAGGAISVTLLASTVLSLWFAFGEVRAKRRLQDALHESRNEKERATLQAAEAILQRNEAEKLGRENYALQAQLAASEQRSRPGANADQGTPDSVESADAGRRAQQLAAFIVEVLQSSDPNAGGEQEVTVVQAMEQALSRIDRGALGRDAASQADLRETIATVLLNHGRLQEAEREFGKVVESRRAGAGGPGELASSLNNLGTAQNALGKFAEAEKNYREALTIRRRLGKPDDLAAATNIDNIGVTLQRQEKLDEALGFLTESLAIYQRLRPGDDADVAKSLTNIGYLLRNMGRFEDAAARFEESLAMMRRVHPQGHPDVALCMNGLAGVKRVMGKLDEAEPLYRESLEMRRRWYKGDHPDLAVSLANFGLFLGSRGRPDEGVGLLRESLAMSRRSLPRDHVDVVTCLNNLGSMLVATKQYGDAEAAFSEAVEMGRRISKEDNEDAANALMGLGRARHGLAKRAEARSSLDESVAMQRRMAAGQDSFGLARALYRSGCVRLENGEIEEARKELGEAVAMGERVLPAGHGQLKEFRDALERCK